MNMLDAATINISLKKNNIESGGFYLQDNGLDHFNFTSRLHSFSDGFSIVSNFLSIATLIK